MPKVTEDYINQKKSEILDAALTVFGSKPLYDITMLDVIKEAGLSKGGIYRYYTDIDDLLVAMINRESGKQSYLDSIAPIMQLDRVSAVRSLLAVLGGYLNRSAATIGKIQMELTLLVATQPQRAGRITGRLIEQENGQYLMGSLFDTVAGGLAAGEFRSTMSLEEIISFIQVYIEGLVKMKVLDKCYGLGEPVDAEKMTALLAQSVLELLGVREE